MRPRPERTKIHKGARGCEKLWRWSSTIKTWYLLFFALSLGAAGQHENAAADADVALPDAKAIDARLARNTGIVYVDSFDQNDGDDAMVARALLFLHNRGTLHFGARTY